MMKCLPMLLVNAVAAAIQMQRISLGGVKATVHYPPISPMAPAWPTSIPAAIFFHGGGVEAPVESTYGGLINASVARGIAIVAIESNPSYPGIPSPSVVASCAIHASSIIGNLTTAGIGPRVDLQQVALMGHSMGGLISMDLAASPIAALHPLLQAVISLHGPAFLSSPESATLPLLLLSGSKDLLAWL